MISAKTKLGDFISWYTSFGKLTKEEAIKTIVNYAWAIDQQIAESFINNNWDKYVTIMECEKCNGSIGGEHDGAIICDEFIIKFESVDYAFTPENNSEVI